MTTSRIWTTTRDRLKRETETDQQRRTNRQLAAAAPRSAPSMLGSIIAGSAGFNAAASSTPFVDHALRTLADRYAAYRSPASLFEQLERELVTLLKAEAPRAWARDGKTLSRLLRRARTDLRALERRSLTLCPPSRD